MSWQTTMKAVDSLHRYLEPRQQTIRRHYRLLVDFHKLYSRSRPLRVRHTWTIHGDSQMRWDSLDRLRVTTTQSLRPQPLLSFVWHRLTHSRHPNAATIHRVQQFHLWLSMLTRKGTRTKGLSTLFLHGHPLSLPARTIHLAGRALLVIFLGLIVPTFLQLQAPLHPICHHPFYRRPTILCVVPSPRAHLDSVIRPQSQFLSLVRLGHRRTLDLHLRTADERLLKVRN